jgi:cytochrome P450
MTDEILSNLRAGNINLAEAQNDALRALVAAPEDLERLARNVDDHLKCAQAHYAQAMSDLKIHRGVK